MHWSQFYASLKLWIWKPKNEEKNDKNQDQSIGVFFLAKTFFFKTLLTFENYSDTFPWLEVKAIVVSELNLSVIII